MSPSSDYLRDEINKRLTLNLLIQGSAQHAFLTSHYLVRDELTALDSDLLRLYEVWLKTGSPRAHALLREGGVNPVVVPAGRAPN